MAGVRLIQLLLVLSVIGVISYLLRLSHALKLEKRIGEFAIVNRKDKELSLFDKIENSLWHLNQKLAKILKKSQVLSNYGEKYNKFISYDEREEKEGIDFVAEKFLLSFLVLILSFITCAFQQINIDLIFFLIIFIIVFFIPDVYLNIKFSFKRKKVEDDLLKAIIIMNNAFQSGRNIMQAIEIVKSELDGPIQDEFKKIYLDITYGLSLDVVFNRFYERVKLEDAKYITSSLTLLNKTGGDIIKVFSLIEKSFFDKKNLRNELNSLTATSRFMFKLLIALPFTPLFTNPLGIIILVFTILLYILYILVVKRIMEVEL